MSDAIIVNGLNVLKSFTFPACPALKHSLQQKQDTTEDCDSQMLLLKCKVESSPHIIEKSTKMCCNFVVMFSPRAQSINGAYSYSRLVSMHLSIAIHKL